jgi:eukaryotic-like serine/threonine-protein kinase
VLRPGEIVGDKYRLEEPIGQGGMATIWRAVHTTLERPVAVKFLEAVGAASDQVAERFLQEAKLLAGLRHRHVVDILDFGVTGQTGQPFMVMELLVGKSLADRYTDGPPVSDWELLEIVAMTLSGLAAVHDAGILHRDVKPENIFLVEDADGIYPKLLDFGISRGFGAAGRITRTGSVVGTPQYMSPEQARGKKDLDARGDLWSVGIVLYEGFSGEVPFDSENPGDVLIAVATEEILALKDMRPDLPRSVTELVHKALRKDPAERFQSAREMREAVMEVLQRADPMTGRPSSTVIRTAYGNNEPQTGKLRRLSVPPGISNSEISGEPIQIPKQGAVPVQAAPEPTLSEYPVSVSVEPEQSESREGSRGGGLLGAVLTALLLTAIGVGGYFAWTNGWIPGASAISEPTGRSGAVLPGAEVAVSDLGDQAQMPPPPDDGLPAPPTETIDVPSPPDPPNVAGEHGLGGDPTVAVPDAGPAAIDAGAAVEESPREARRRRLRERMRRRHR